jgi:glycosyltransferase 2 family protein
VKHLRNWRLWLGLAVTALALWFAFRDVSWSALGREMARANWWLLLGVSLPAYVWSVQLRAARWRVLARGVADVPASSAFRATAVGFLVNNVLPLRIGEFVRVWWLAREIRCSVPALVGTVILERVIDMVSLLGLASLVIGNEVGRGVLLGAAAVPLAATLALRRWPAPALRAVRRAAGLVLSVPRAERITGIAGSVAQGVAALRGGADFARMAWLTVLLWGVAAVIPFWAALTALGIDLGGFAASLRGALLILVYVAAAVALPAAPGFFGPYHAACRYALTPLGVPKELALALGTLAHAVFWIGTTGIGLVCLRGGTQRLSEAVTSASAEPSSEPVA